MAILENVNLIILVAAGLTVISVLSSMLAFRAGAPLLLFFLGVGVVAGGQGLGGIVFAHAPNVFLLGNAALAVILFDSGFHTSVRHYRQAALPALILATAGVAITTLIVAIAVHALLHQAWPESLLLGAILSSTDAAAVFFFLRAGKITLRDRVRSILEIESSTNDPIAATLVLSLVALVAVGHGPPPSSLSLGLMIAWQTLIGLALGLLGGGLIVVVVNRVRLEPGLYPVAVMALALTIFAASGVIGGSGYIAVYVAGLVAGNARLNWSGSLRRFQDGVSWLAQIAMFVSLGLIAVPRHFSPYLGDAALLYGVLTLVARPLAVFVTLAPFRIGTREKLFIAWMGVRGAVSLVFALVPVLAGAPDGESSFYTAFLVVVASLTLQGWSVRPLARWLGLVVPEKAGPVDRSMVDLPGLADRELVVYKLHPDSAVAMGRPLPRWAQPLLARRGDTIRSNPARLQAGDLVYLLVSPTQIPLLDRMFGRPRGDGDDTLAMFGDFSITPDASWTALQQTYGLPAMPSLSGVADANDDRELTVGAMLRQQLNDDLEEGDRLRLGSIDLIVEEMENGTLRSIGISLDPTAQPQLGWERLLAALRRRMRR